MKAIFTYPNNAATHYIDPNYVGDNTTGYKKRINDLLLGVTFPWNGALPSVDADTFMETTSKYYRYYEFGAPDDSSEISSVAFNRRPALIGQTTYNTPQDITEYYGYTASDGGPMEIAYIVPNHGYTDGKRIIVRNADNTLSISGYVKVLDSNSFRIASNTGLWNFPRTIDYTTVGSHRFNWFGRSGNGVRYYCHPYGGISLDTQGIVDGDAVRLASILKVYSSSYPGTESVTGSINNKPQTFYVKRIPGDAYSLDLYTDPGLTIRATMDETYYGTVTYTYTNTTGAPVVYTLENLGNLPDGLGTYDTLTNASGRIARVKYQNLSGGTITTPVAALTGIPTEYSYDNNFWYSGSDTSKDIYDIRFANIDVGNPIDFELSPGASVDIVVSYAKSTSSWNSDIYLVNSVDIPKDVLSYDAVIWENNGTITPARWISSIDLQVPGNLPFEYLDSGGNSVFGAQPSWYVGPGGYPTDFVTAPVINFTNVGGGNNRIATATLDTSGQLGVVDPSYEEVIIAIQPKPSEYVPPAPTPAEIASWEDGWDLNSEWDNRTGWESNKDWPLIPYKSIKVKMNQPSVKTMSQSGQKYIRSGGYARWTMDVEYPPLTEEQFNEILTVSHLARGQATVFEFFFKDYYPVDDILQWGNWWEWRHWQPKTYPSPAGPGVSTVNPIVIRWLDDRTVLVDGYASNESNPVPEGQLINIGLPRNGAVALVVNSNDANVYGELAIRVAYNDFAYKPIPSNNIWTTPHSITVSLASDELNYTLGADGYYYLTVSFELDHWK